MRMLSVFHMAGQVRLGVRSVTWIIHSPHMLAYSVWQTRQHKECNFISYEYSRVRPCYWYVSWDKNVYRYMYMYCIPSMTLWGVYMYNFFSAGTVNVTLQDVLIFVTTLDCKPPLGFRQLPRLRFIHDDERILPTACTCSCVLSLPTAPCEYHLFRRWRLEEETVALAECKDWTSLRSVFTLSLFPKTFIILK